MCVPNGLVCDHDLGDLGSGEAPQSIVQLHSAYLCTESEFILLLALPYAENRYHIVL